MLRIVKIKICGITNVEDALAAVDMGADILGFNFYDKSPRYIKPDAAIKIIDKLPTYVDTAGVFVNPEYEQIKQTTEEGYLNWIQLHGDETYEFFDSLRHFPVRTIKAIRIKSQDDFADVEKYSADAILLDAYDVQIYGGTGKTFDWNTIPNLKRRIFLAGGINPDNVEDALDVGVYGLDICSGIEKEPGKKDHKKMGLLFERIHALTG